MSARGPSLFLLCTRTLARALSAPEQAEAPPRARLERREAVPAPTLVLVEGETRRINSLASLLHRLIRGAGFRLPGLI
jgi:hypothetical protein